MKTMIRIVDGQAVGYSLGQLMADNPQTSFPRAPSPEMLAEYGVYEAELTGFPATRFHVEAGFQASQVNGVWTVERQFSVGSLAEVKAQAAAELSTRRDAKIEAGFDFGGVTVPCDDKSIGRYTAAYVLARDNPEVTRQWKLPTGFVELNAQQLIALATGAAEFVQACFDEQAEQLAEIEAATTVEEVETILTTAG